MLLELSTHGGEDCQVSCSALLPFNTFSYMFFSFALLSVELMQACSIQSDRAVVICCGDIYLVKARLTCARTHARFMRNTRERAPRSSSALTGTVSQHQSCSMSAARWPRNLRHARGLNTARTAARAANYTQTKSPSSLLKASCSVRTAITLKHAVRSSVKKMAL